MDSVVNRTAVIRPIAVAVLFTVVGEIIYFLLWGVIWFPAGELWRKVGWTATCGLAMGIVIGAVVLLLAMQSRKRPPALTVTGAVYAGVLLYCTALCLLIARSVGYFGANSDPALFIGGSVIPIIVSTGFYAWLVATENGAKALARIGL